MGCTAISASTINRLLSCVAAALVALWTFPVHARSYPWDKENEIRGNYEEPKPWIEQGTSLPAYPDPAHLLNVPVQIPGSNLEMFLDETSLTIGGDGVVRFVPTSAQKR